jgi:hypothetical protein
MCLLLAVNLSGVQGLPDPCQLNLRSATYITI